MYVLCRGQLKKSKQNVFKFGPINLFDKNSKIRVNKSGVKKVMKIVKKPDNVHFSLGQVHMIDNLRKLKFDTRFLLMELKIFVN